MAGDEIPGARLRLLRPLDPTRDHFRGRPGEDSVEVVGYQDFLCPYCRRLRQVLKRLRERLGDRLVYVYRQFPNERANPGADLAARASEAAALQGRFFEMHDRLFDHQPPIGRDDLVDFARTIGIDVAGFVRDLDGDQTRARVDEDLADGRRNGVTATPTLFIDGIRYDGAWDFDSLLEALERPIAARVHRTARVFASLPTSTGLVLLGTALLALVCANTPLAPTYQRFMNTQVGVGPSGSALLLTVREWFSEGLLAVFFLLVGLEIRREMTGGALASWRAALLPILAAAGGVVAPALVYLLFNRGPASRGWSIPTATDVAFTLALLAVLGSKVPVGLRVFVAAFAVVDDILSVFTLAIFYPRSFAPSYTGAVIGSLLVLVAFNRARVYAIWPYVVAGVTLWLSLHAVGIDAALAGVLLAMCLPSRPSPAAAPLLAQAATALAALEHAERQAKTEGRHHPNLEGEPVWEWAARNLSAASERLLSPAERVERAVSPWSAFVILPLFAFSATGVGLTFELSSHDAGSIFAGTVAGLVIGKPLGILLASGLAIGAGLALPPAGVARRQFVAAACLGGVSDTLALVMADRAFSPTDAGVAKLAVFTGSLIAGALGTILLLPRAVAATPTRS
ncbi:MAG TPA: Na+/H+ antiporter NhaA [Polyangiaceae bacterium]|nr:Na+/H+ antiporter NhaA [Polyangiaceae bacterium]